MARIYRTGPGRWAIDYRDAAGRRVRRIVGTRSEATEALAVAVRESTAGRFGLSGRRRATLGEVRDHQLADAARRAKRSLGHDRLRWGRIVSVFGEGRVVATIRGPEVETLRAALERDGLGPASRNRHLALLRSGLRLAARDSLIERAPHVALEPEPRSRDRLWSDDELASVLDEASPRQRLAILLARDAALRLGEACRLRWEDVSLDDDPPWLRVGAAKTEASTGRPIPLTERLAAELAAARPETGSGWVLPAASGVARAWSPETASSNLARLFRSVGISARYHDLRHTRLTEIAARGADLGTVADYAGHSVLSTTRRYVHRRAADLAERIGEKQHPHHRRKPASNLGGGGAPTKGGDPE